MRPLEWERLLAEHRITPIPADELRWDNFAFFVYLHLRPDGTPFYVGKGSSTRARLLNRPRSRSYRKIVRECGREHIGVCAIPCHTERASFELERRCIAILRDAGIRLCNKTDGGEGATGHKHSASARAAISRGNTGKTIPKEQRELISKALLGHPTPDATRRKISQTNKGRIISQESRAKQRASLLGRPQTPESNKKRSATLKGHSISEETRAKISATLRRKNVKSA